MSLLFLLCSLVSFFLSLFWFRLLRIVVVLLLMCEWDCLWILVWDVDCFKRLLIVDGVGLFCCWVILRFLIFWYKCFFFWFLDVNIEVWVFIFWWSLVFLWCNCLFFWCRLLISVIFIVVVLFIFWDENEVVGGCVVGENGVCFLLWWKLDDEFVGSFICWVIFCFNWNILLCSWWLFLLFCFFLVVFCFNKFF